MLLLVPAVICFISPEGTFAALADTLGFVLFFVGVRWMIEAFLERVLGGTATEGSHT
jgi:hypothetical protein